MLDTIKNLSVDKCNDARMLYLYLYFNNGKNLEYVGNKILATGNLRYIHFLLRTFEIDNYNISYTKIQIETV